MLASFADFFYICGIHFSAEFICSQFRNSEQLAIFACCAIRNKTNEQTKSTLQVYERDIFQNFVIGIHLHFEFCLKTRLWNTGIFIQQVVRLSSAQCGPS